MAWLIFLMKKGKLIISFCLCFCINSVKGTTTITTSCNGLITEPLNITCTIDPYNTEISLILPNRTYAAVCSAPTPYTVCSEIKPYTTDYIKVGTKIIIVLSIPLLDIVNHNGTWGCTHGLESSTGEVLVNSPLSSQGKEPTFTAKSTSPKLITLGGEVYCQHPISAITFEVLYAEQNGAYITLNPQPSTAVQNLGSDECVTHESNISFSGILSCDNYTLAGKTFTLMARFNQSNLPPDSNTYSVTSFGSFYCPVNPPEKALSMGGVTEIGALVFFLIVFGVLVCIFIVVFVVGYVCKHKRKGNKENKKAFNLIKNPSSSTSNKNEPNVDKKVQGNTSMTTASTAAAQPTTPDDTKKQQNHKKKNKKPKLANNEDEIENVQNTKEKQSDTKSNIIIIIRSVTRLTSDLYILMLIQNATETVSK